MAPSARKCFGLGSDQISFVSRHVCSMLAMLEGISPRMTCLQEVLLMAGRAKASLAHVRHMVRQPAAW